MLQTGGMEMGVTREEALELAREFLGVYAKVMGPSYAMEAEIREMTPFAGVGIKAAGGRP